ncbi:MAG: hypothetical protein Q8O67_14145 [Deltaproteobacteria bacterium]|nr:hypothetical protein [Deltaproteobacteria bacterium]
MLSACGPSQECRSYVQCQQAIDASVDVAAYDDDGPCWALPQTARECTAICVEALAALRALPDPPAACDE